MKRNWVLAIIGGALVVIVAWWFLWYSPAQDDIDATNANVASLQDRESALRANLARLKADQRDLPQLQQTSDLLQKLIPNTPALEKFIAKANTIAQESGVDWVSVTPSPPAANGAGPSVIALAIQIQGRFATVLDYMNRLADYNTFERLVIVDGVNLTAASNSGATAGTETGSPTLTVSLTARMFTYAEPEGTTGTGSTAPSNSPIVGGSGNSTTSAPASGSASTTSGGQIDQTRRTVTSANNQLESNSQ